MHNFLFIRLLFVFAGIVFSSGPLYAEAEKTVSPNFIASGQVWISQFNYTLKINKVDSETGLVIGEMISPDKTKNLPLYGFIKERAFNFITSQAAWSGYVFPSEPNKIYTFYYSPGLNVTDNYKYFRMVTGQSIFHKVH